MTGSEILAHNHDTHFHSREYSDGKHPVCEIAHFTSRWQTDPRWVGISDHSPDSEEPILRYLEGIHESQELLVAEGVTLLTGMEWEWKEVEPLYTSPHYDALDYILVGYHGMKFTRGEEVAAHYERISRNPYADIAAHPDRFLGTVDVMSIDWERIFNQFAERHVICEYNLTTPLHGQVYEIAARQTGVQFSIGSDTHDFRSIAVRRVIDAWSESIGGGFDLAYDYLTRLLRLECSAAQFRQYAKVFQTPELLDVFQHKLFLQSWSDVPAELGGAEGAVVSLLDKIPENEIDKEFLTRRLERFAALPAERICSLLLVEGFLERISESRDLRIATLPFVGL